MRRTMVLYSFEPFLKWKTNAGTVLAGMVKERPPLAGALEHVILPVCYEKAGQLVMDMVRQQKPSLVLGLGLHGRARHLLWERLAVNAAHSSYGDAAGTKCFNQMICALSPAAYWATIPHRSVLDLAKRRSLPVKLSFHAGTYICNNTLFMTLDAAARENLPFLAGFIHVPPLKGKGKLSAESLAETLYQILVHLQAAPDLG